MALKSSTEISKINSEVSKTFTDIIEKLLAKERLLKERDRLLGTETEKERKAGEDLFGSLLNIDEGLKVNLGGINELSPQLKKTKRRNVPFNLPAKDLIKLFNGRNTEQVESMLATRGYKITMPLENNRLTARKRYLSGSYRDLTLVFRFIPGFRVACLVGCFDQLLHNGARNQITANATISCDIQSNKAAFQIKHGTAAVGRF